MSDLLSSPEQKGYLDQGQIRIEGLQKSYEKVTPAIRELLGLKQDEADSFFIGLYGSCVKGKATENSDIDGYLFYSRTPNTPKNFDLNYDLAQSFDSPAQSLFGHPAGKKAPNLDGKEDIEAHDITDLVDEISSNDYLLPDRLKEIAIIFSPQFIGSSQYLDALRKKILEGMKLRSGISVDDPGNRQRRNKKGIVHERFDPSYEQFEDFIADGSSTWLRVEKEYEKLFEAKLPESDIFKR